MSGKGNGKGNGTSHYPALVRELKEENRALEYKLLQFFSGEKVCNCKNNTILEQEYKDKILKLENKLEKQTKLRCKIGGKFLRLSQSIEALHKDLLSETKLIIEDYN